MTYPTYDEYGQLLSYRRPADWRAVGAVLKDATLAFWVIPVALALAGAVWGTLLLNRLRQYGPAIVLMATLGLYLACLGPGQAGAGTGRLHPEKYYQVKWCERQGGRTEVRLRDRTRCDCLTEQYAIEFDFADKWAEALGQALHYGRMTGRTPGIVLILEKDADWKYYLRLMYIVRKFHLPVRVWVMLGHSQ